MSEAPASAPEAGSAPEAAPAAAPTPAPAPEAASAPQPAPESQPDWRASLPEDLQAEPSLQDIKDITGLAKGYVHAQKLVGMDKQRFAVVPGEDAGEDAWNEFYEKVGRPETADAYQLPEVKLEGVERNEDMEKWYKDTAHKFGLSAKQAAGLYEEYMSFAKGSWDQNGTQLEQMRDAGTQAIKQEWGAAFDRKMGAAVNVLKNHASEDFLDMLDNTGLGNHPEMMKMLASIAEAAGEDTLTDKSKVTNARTPAEANAEIARKQSDPDFMKAYLTADHPSHDWAVGEMTRLTKDAVAGGTP